MEKDKILILTQYADAAARIKYLRREIAKLEDKMSKMLNTDYGIASDTVTKGKRGKKPLGTVKVTGFRQKEYIAAENQAYLKKLTLKQREEELLELQNQAEEFIESIRDIEMRNILSLYYIEGLTWLQVANSMNELYEKKGKKAFTNEGCRKKVDRFLEKFLK